MLLVRSVIVAVIVASCTRSKMPTPVQISPTVLPSQTVSAGPSPTPLLPQIIATPLPTLTSNDAKKLVKELLNDNAGCMLPCWWGITPGKTTWTEARSFLETFSLYVGENGGVRVPLPSPYSDATYMEHQYFIKNGIVDNIRVFNFNLAPNYYFPKFLETYGQPEEVRIRTFAREEMGVQNFTVDLFYQDLGILVEYSTGEPLKDVDGKLQNCLLKEMDSPFIFLWSPNEQNLSFEEAKQKFLDTRNLPEPKPLFEATGMDVKNFYETFKNPETHVCLETPKSLWP